MASENNAGKIADDTFQETVTQYSSRLLDKGAEALRGAARDARALADAAADRATHFKSLLANLDALNTSVYQQLSSFERSALATEFRATVEAYRREIGKAEGIFKSAMQSENASSAMSALSKNLGSLISAIEFVSTVSDPKATDFSVGRDLAALGGSILAGAAIGYSTAPVLVVVGVAAIGGLAGRFAWNSYAQAIGWDEKTSPNFHDTMRSTFSTVRNAFGFTLSTDAEQGASKEFTSRLTSDLEGVAAVTWPDGTRQALQADSPGAKSELTFRKDGGYTKITRQADGRVGHQTVDALGAIIRSQAPVPAGVTLSPNQFYIDETANSLNKISDLTGVSASTLMGLNPGLGVSAGTQPIGVGQMVNLPAPTNLINIEITSEPQPQSGSTREGKAAQDVHNGFVQNRATSKISFSDETLNRTDFVSARMGSLATGGIRPGEFQLDPNAKPGAYLGQRYLDPLSTGNPNALGLNAATLNGLSAMTTFNTYVDPILLDLSGDGVKMTGIEDGVMFDVDHSGALKRTGWAERTTGILVVDEGNGQIVDASQMISEYYSGRAGVNGSRGETPFKDSFAALASVDANADGVIDANDTIWAKLKVWVDSDHDAQSGTGELKTLDELGITQINVAASSAASGETLKGNEVIGRGTFTMNGQTRELMAVNFLADPIGNTFTQVEGGSRITSTAGTITRTAYSSTSTIGETLDAASLGVDNVYAGRGDTTLIAAPSGSWLVGGGGSNTYQGGAGDDVFVISARDQSNNIHGNGGRDTAIIVGDQGVSLNMAKAGLTIAEGGRGDDVIVSGGNSSVFVKGGQGNTTIIGGGGNDVLVGGSGHNTIIGGSGKAVIYAGPKGDTVYASAQGSIIHAGGGADRIHGGPGDDVIEAGHGNALIDGGGGTNVVTLHGNHGDYTITSTDTGYTVADHQAGRDGALTLKNVQKLNFSDISAVDLTLPNPMPVFDALRVDQAGQAFDHTQPHLVAAAQLLANDQQLSSQGPLKIASVSDAVGGTVALTIAGDVLFTPDPAYTGVMSFKYGVTDAAGHPAASVVDLNSGKSAPMRATATLSTPDVPTDPLAVQEWYLSDANIIPVWKDYTGKGVRIGQFEPGGEFATGPEILDVKHPDLAPNVDPAWLATQHHNGKLPQAVSNHATMVAGVMVAAKNGQGGVGVAYDATVGGHFIANSGGDMTSLANMVNYDIANNSWGFTGDFAMGNLQDGRINTESILLSNAQYAAAGGRGGLGTVIVAAGGNAREKGGSAQGSLTANNRFTIEVGAINAQSDLSTLQLGSAPFSNPGASLLVSAPGSNVVSTSHILETDRGSTFGSQYSDMQGTSFATPIVSGVVALMLQANPNLGYRDVQEILALSARRVRDDATQWRENGARNWNGGGMHASHDYGFGAIDARAAVRMAESWTRQTTAENERVRAGKSGQLDHALTGGSTVRSSIAMQAGLTVQHAEIDVDVDIGRLGDLTVKLISPGGTQSILLDRAGKAPAGAPDAGDADVGSARSGHFKYTFMSTHDWGERSGGDWTLEVTDAESGLPVKLNQWSLRLYGDQATADDTYFYTDEYRKEVAANAARAVLDDNVNGTVGGRNTINAAAVSGDMSVDLTTGAANVAGAALTISQPDAIQNIITGDGNDRLVAGNGNALLDGGRGANTLVGGPGNDFFVVHRRASGLDTIENFDAARGETIDLVGFAGKAYSDLVLSQHDSDVQIDLGNGQRLVVKGQQVAALSAERFLFQDSFIAPANYVNSAAGDAPLPSGLGTVVLKGGAGGVMLTTDEQGRMIGRLTGTIYSHDAATSDTFVIEKQEGVRSYGNALRGFKHGIDKIDLSRTGVTSFNDLVTTRRERAVFNGLAQIHGVSVESKSLGTANQPVELVYLDAIDLAQLSESDFIFATEAPAFANPRIEKTATLPAGDALAPTRSIETESQSGGLLERPEGKKDDFFTSFEYQKLSDRLKLGELPNPTDFADPIRSLGSKDWLGSFDGVKGLDRPKAIDRVNGIDRIGIDSMNGIDSANAIGRIKGADLMKPMDPMKPSDPIVVPASRLPDVVTPPDRLAAGTLAGAINGWAANLFNPKVGSTPNRERPDAHAADSGKRLFGGNVDNLIQAISAFAPSAAAAAAATSLMPPQQEMLRHALAASWQ